MLENLLRELQEVRLRLKEVEGILVTPEAMEVMRRTGTSPAWLAECYRRDRRSQDVTELLGYRLSRDSTRPDSETSVHVVFDPGLDQVVIYEEWQ